MNCTFFVNMFSSQQFNHVRIVLKLWLYIVIILLFITKFDWVVNDVDVLDTWPYIAEKFWFTILSHSKIFAICRFQMMQWQLHFVCLIVFRTKKKQVSVF